MKSKKNKQIAAGMLFLVLAIILNRVSNINDLVIGILYGISIGVFTIGIINSKVIDFVITGCSSGQGINLACNTLPGLLSGFIQNPQDAYLFGRINDGNVASLSLGLGFGWLGELNLEYTLEKLFDGDFGIGFPKEIAERKIKETSRVKKFNQISKVSLIEFMEQLEQEFMAKILSKKDVIDYIFKNSKEEKLIKYLSNKI